MCCFYIKLEINVKFFERLKAVCDKLVNIFNKLTSLKQKFMFNFSIRVRLKL